MNERIKDIALDCIVENIASGAWVFTDKEFEKFSDAVLHGVISELQQEWYDLNNKPKPADETLREIGIRIGQKNGVLKAMNRIKERFGIKNEA